MSHHHHDPPSVVEGAASDLRLLLGPFAQSLIWVGYGIALLAADCHVLHPAPLRGTPNGPSAGGGG